MPAKSPRKPDRLTELIATMKEHRVLHLEVDGIVLDLHPSAFPVITPKMTKAGKDEDVCVCGHHLGYEHSPEGCLRCVNQCGGDPD